MKTARIATIVVTLLASGAAVAAAEKPQRPAKGPPPFSGFLQDYDQLEPTRERGRKRLLSHVMAASRLHGYDAVVIEPIEVRFDPEADVVEPETIEEITDHFRNALGRGTLLGLPVVAEPGPGVLRLRVALTELVPVKKKRGFLAFTGVGSFIVSSARRGAVGAHVAQVSVEVELLDSVTSEQVYAMVERRLGKKKFKKDEEVTAEHVRKALDFWADRLHERVAELGRSTALASRSKSPTSGRARSRPVRRIATVR